METMRISEKKRKSSKGIIIGLLIFFILGGTIIFLAVKAEKQPITVGNNKSDTDRLVNIDANKTAQTIANNTQIAYEIAEKKVTDKTNTKIKADISLPAISIESEEMTQLNNEIYEKYTTAFNNSKDQLSKADNKYTYKVTYKVYENMIAESKIVSITVFARTIDDSSNKNATEMLNTYNIDLTTKKLTEESAIATNMFGKDYKTKIRTAVKDYLVSQNMLKEEDYTYAITGLENFYIKDGKFHIYFNAGEIVDKKYGMLDITVE